MPESGGAVVFSALDATSPGRMAGSFDEVVLGEVVIDPATLATTPVPGGRRVTLTDRTFDAEVRDLDTEAECGGHGHRHGAHCHCDAGYAPDPSDPLQCVPA